MTNRLDAAVVRLAFWVPLMVSAWLALTPKPPGVLFSLSDGFLHVAAFAYLTFAARLAYPVRSPWMIALCMLGYGALLELLQGLGLARVAEWRDWFMDLAGVAIGLALFAVTGPLVRRTLARLGRESRG